MKKSFGTLLIAFVVGFVANGQGRYTPYEDTLRSLRKTLVTIKDEKKRIPIYNDMAGAFSLLSMPDSAIFYGLKGLALARKIASTEEELHSLASIAVDLRHSGNEVKALSTVLLGLKEAEQYRNKRYEALFVGELGILNRSSGNYSKAIRQFEKSKELYDSLKDLEFSAYQLNNIGEVHLMQNQLDSAFSCSNRALEIATQLDSWVIYYSSFTLGNIDLAKHNYPLALSDFRRALSMAAFYSHHFDCNLSIAKTYQNLGKRDSCFFYAEQTLIIARESRSYANLVEANMYLARIYEDTDMKKAFQFAQTSLSYKDSLDKFNRNLVMEGFAEFDEQERQQELMAAAEEYRTRIRQLELLTGVGVLVLVAAILYRNNRQKQKANTVLEQTLNNLKSTQSQLIQSEKMASLGELTAGIAHEIQNPLNFVNNFSEVNSELISEMKAELAKGNIEAAREIAKTIDENENKILSHGKRADAIVKGMLQHSRSSSGVKEPTDINALADEYLRLAYHGLRAKDKSFNAVMKTDFDATIGSINLIPQDMGRVILNLITNAFYAVTEKRKGLPDNYEPTVIVSTKKTGNEVQISVKDNGNGVPQKVLDKIFQPFFTTKPTGQGTGLGLSLSYDIIRAHDGELKVQTEEGKFAEFIVLLPFV